MLAYTDVQTMPARASRCFSRLAVPPDLQQRPPTCRPHGSSGYATDLLRRHRSLSATVPKHCAIVSIAQRVAPNGPGSPGALRFR